MGLLVIFGFAVVLGCAPCSGNRQAFQQNMPVNNRNKIDAGILTDIKSNQRAGQEVSILIKTKAEITAVQKGMIEKEGGRIGSVIGDIITVTTPIEAVSKIANFDFVVYIEKARRHKSR